MNPLSHFIDVCGCSLMVIAAIGLLACFIAGALETLPGSAFAQTSGPITDIDLSRYCF